LFGKQTEWTFFEANYYQKEAKKICYFRLQLRFCTVNIGNEAMTGLVDKVKFKEDIFHS